MASHPILPYVKGLSSVNEVSHLMKERDEILGVLKANLLTTRSKWSNMPMLNDGRCSLRYMIRFMWRCPYRQSSLNRFKHPKLAPRFIGPFMIVTWIGLFGPSQEIVYSPDFSCFYSSQGSGFKQAIIPNSQRFGCWFFYTIFSNRSVGSSQNKRKWVQPRSLDPLERGHTW